MWPPNRPTSHYRMSQTNWHVATPDWLSDIQTEYDILEEYKQYEKVSSELMRLESADKEPGAKRLDDSINEFRKMLAKQRQARIAVIKKLRIMNYEAQQARGGSFFHD